MYHERRKRGSVRLGLLCNGEKIIIPVIFYLPVNSLREKEARAKILWHFHSKKSHVCTCNVLVVNNHTRYTINVS